MIKRMMSSILVLVICLNVGFTANAAVLNKSTEDIANVVYFVDFKDSGSNFMDGKLDRVKNMFEGDKESSLTNYIKTISYNQMNVHNYFPQEIGGEIISYKLPNNRAYYDKTNEQELLTTVLNNVVVDKNYNIDMNNDGFVDNVIFIFEAKQGSEGDVLWAHKANLNGATKVNGKSVDDYNVHNSYSLMGSLAASEQGVLIHEFMHSIGYPDLYKSSGSATPVGRWDILASVSSFVQYPLSYLRSAISNWISIDTVKESGTYTLKPVGNSENDQALILKTPISEKEFFVVEYRKRGNPYIDELDGKIPGDGLIIYRVNNDESSNYYGEKDYIYVFRPGETVEGDGNGNLSEAFLSKESGRITYGNSDFTKKISDKAITYSSGQNSGIVIENVSNAGEEITFDIKFTDTKELNIWDVVGNEEVSNKTNNDVDIDVVGDKVYAAYNEDNKLKSKVFDGSKWTNLGESIINKIGNDPTISVHNNIPYVLYHDSSYKSVVVRFVNGSWETVQTLTSDISQYSDMISTNEGVYVAITDGKTSYMNEGAAYLKVFKLNKNTNKFEQCGSDLHKGYVVEPSLSESNGRLYVSYTDFELSNKVFIKKYENNTWTDIQGMNLSASRATVKADNSKLYLAVTSVSGENSSQVYLYENNKWTKIGEDVGGSEVGNLVIDSNNKTPYVAYTNNKSGFSIVKKLDGDKWIQEGSNVSDELISKLDFKISNNKAYVAINPMTSKKLLVKSRVLEESNTEDKEEIIEVLNVTLNKSEISLLTGTSEILVPTVNPSNATNKAVTWTSSNSKVATVDASGKVTGISLGIATITLKTKDGSKIASANVTVKEGLVQVSSITLNKGELNLLTGASETLIAAVNPSNASNKAVEWTSSNSNVATVDANGKVTAIGAGTATITVKTKDGKKIATSKVTVKKPVISVIENKLIGEDRYKTAIKVSNEGWKKSDNVVILNSSAIVDALSATPFAKMKNAPILLTGLDKLNDETKKEIIRLGAKNVYVIGGTGVVSENIISQLKAMNIKVDRISGNDRYSTALEVAKRLTNVSEIAVVNGVTGLADAVSIAPVAADRNMPIVLSSPKEGTKIFNNFIKANNIKISYVIGGEGAISKEIASKLPNSTRLGGLNRNQTNGIILEKFYINKDLNNIFVTKNGMKKANDLIDALAVGVLASKENSPVVIVGDKLDTKQEKLLSSKNPKEITQVGGSGNESAFRQLVNMFKN